MEDKRPTKEAVEGQVKHAFKEFVITGGMFGLTVPRKAIDVVWDRFYRGLGWRLGQLYESKEKKKFTKEDARKLTKKIYD